jgi:uncharacterized phage protein (TIGR02218 family)
MLDLVTFTETNGTVLRYNSGCYTINVGGFNYVPAALEVGNFKQALGTNVDDLAVNWYYTTSDTISGVQIPASLRSGAFNYAIVQHSNLFMTSWSLTANANYVLPLFTGLLQMDTIGRSKAELRIKAMTDLLNNQVPSLIYQPGCMNNLYDLNTCGVNRAAFTAGGNLAAGSNQSTLQVSGLTQPAGYYSRGSMVFTSGLNIGVISTIQTHSNGQLTLMWPLPFQPTTGDTFTVVPSCNRTTTTCQYVFNNLPKYRGTPFIPTPSITMGA